jgi:ankyrin repeat protein
MEILNPLLAASSNGHVETMKTFIDAGADINETDKKGNNALYHAICSGNIEAVKVLLTCGLKIYRNRFCGTPLHTAAYLKNAPILLLLLEHGVGDISALDGQGCTALHNASLWQKKNDAPDLLAILLDHGAAIDQLSSYGKPALHYAVENGNTAAILLLLERGANATLTDWRDGQTALHKARSEVVAAALLAHGALVDAVDGEGMTPLHRLASHRTGTGEAVPTARVLLQTGADVNDSPLHLLPSYDKSPEFAQLLLDHGAAIDQLSRDGKPALHYAVEHGNTAAILLLLERGANATLVDSDGQTALHKARTEVVATALLAHGAPVDAVDGEGRTALHCHASYAYGTAVPIAYVLLQAGADANATDANGDAPLHLLARKHTAYRYDKSPEFAQLLLDHGAAIDQLSSDGKPALHYAVKHGNTAAILLLLERGANATLVDSDGQTALHKARTEVVATALLAHGALVDAVDGEGKTPLHRLASRRSEEAVCTASVLLQAGADANATDRDGDMPLHCWAREPSFDAYDPSHDFAQLLIDLGADVAARNNANQRPSDLARRGGSNHTFLLAAEEAQLNNHCYKRPRPEDLQPPAAIAPVAEAAAPAAAAEQEEEEEEEEDESEGDSEDEEEEEDD